MVSPNVAKAAPSPSPTDSPARSLALVDAAAIMRIKNLQLRARLVVEGFLSGLHRSPYHGFSVEFTEYRQYSLGDDLRFLDWRLFARSDRYYVKRFEDETNLRCHLLVDLSRSMAYGSLSYNKAAYAKTAAATIAHFLTLQRDAVGLVTFDDDILEYVPARYRPGHFHRLLVALDRSPSGAGTDLAAPLEQVARVAHKRGMVLLISDLLAPAETLETQLGYLRSRGHEVVILRVLDPTEIDFPFHDPAMFQDLETNREVYIDPESLKERYQERFAAHAAAVKGACDRLGVDLYELATDKPLGWALFDLINSRVRRGRQVSRRQGPARRAPVTGGP